MWLVLLAVDPGVPPLKINASSSTPATSSVSPQYPPQHESGHRIFDSFISYYSNFRGKISNCFVVETTPKYWEFRVERMRLMFFVISCDLCGFAKYRYGTKGQFNIIWTIFRLVPQDRFKIRRFKWFYSMNSRIFCHKNRDDFQFCFQSIFEQPGKLSLC
ncbi:unnamed protein product [Caenorhabditis angaria]|uniref:Uncharacterized protein n=1 Tax=Caenorhabditis angaria TaxID=860376 RepID=A0A9P1J191_9PELO|nr:unnamed protein product [Caenorhabditis angaria]